MLDMQKFFAKCAKEGRDPAAMLARFASELQRLRVRRPDLVQALYAEFAKERSQSDARGPASMTEDEPYYPCGWCKDQGIWGGDYCGWMHWFICDWWGYGCVDCGGEPPPE